MIDTAEWGEMRADVHHTRALLEAHVLAETTAREDHEQRIRTLEKWKWSLPMAGILAFFGVTTAAN